MPVLCRMYAADCPLLTEFHAWLAHPLHLVLQRTQAPLALPLNGRPRGRDCVSSVHLQRATSSERAQSRAELVRTLVGCAAVLACSAVMGEGADLCDGGASERGLTVRSRL